MTRVLDPDVPVGRDRADVAGPTSPIFIVGTSRSGTSLLAGMLGAHRAIACGPETALFLNFKGAKQGILDDPRWPDRAVEFLTNLARPTVDGRVIDHFGLTPDAIRAHLAGTQPSLRHLLEAITVPHMVAQGKRRWAEKSPGHLWSLPLCRQLWPDARFVRIVRDPRGVVASFRDVPFTRRPVKVAYHWRMEDELWTTIAAADDGCVTVRYEDLLADPEATLRTLCWFLGERFDPGMVADGGRAGVVVPGEWWKERVGQPLDRGRATAWRSELTPEEHAQVALICADGMRRNGYEGAVAPRARVWLHPWLRSAARAEEVLERLAAEGIVGDPLDGLDPHARQRILVVGEPGELAWADGRRGPYRALATWYVRLMLARLRGRPALWVRHPLGRRADRSAPERAGDLLLRILGRRVTADQALDTLAR